MTRRLQWGSITRHTLRSGVVKYRARAGDEERRGLGLYDTWEHAELALDEARRGHEALMRSRGPASSFASYGRAWLDAEERRRVRRGLHQERSRFAAHLERAPFAIAPVATIEQRDVQRWARTLVTTTARGITIART